MLPSLKVGMAEMAVTDRPELLCVNGLGSCVALMLWDPQARVGGMMKRAGPSSPSTCWAPLILASSSVVPNWSALVGQVSTHDGAWPRARRDEQKSHFCRLSSLANWMAP